MPTGLGTALTSLAAELASVEVFAPAELDNLPAIAAVVLVGGTCAGKSTLLAAIREGGSTADGLVHVPHRYTTRSSRMNDDPTETSCLDADAFRALNAAGTFAIAWHRELDGSPPTCYGIARSPPGSLPVYLGGNGLYDCPESVQPPGALNRCVMIGVHAPDDVRSARLGARSPDLIADRPQEAAARLALGTANMLPHIHVLVHNHGPFEANAATDVVRLVDAVAPFAIR